MRTLGRAICRGPRQGRRRFHALDRDRRRARRRRHRGFDRACPRARARRAADRRTRSTTLVGGLDGARRGRRGRAGSTWDPALEDVHMNLEAALAEQDRAAGRAAPHRPVAQRPGRHGPAALDAPGASTTSTRRLLAFERALVGLAEREGDAVLPGTTHIQPAQPVLFAPSPARLRRDGRARPRPAGRRAPARSTFSPLGAGRAGRRRLSARSRGDGGRARVRRRHRELARRGQRPRLRGRDARGGRARDGPPQPARRGDRRGGRTRGSGSSASPTRSRPAAR